MGLPPEVDSEDQLGNELHHSNSTKQPTEQLRRTAPQNSSSRCTDITMDPLQGAEIFESYELEFQDVATEIEAQIRRKDVESGVDAQLVDLRDLFSQLETEVETQPSVSMKDALTPRLDACKETLKRLEASQARNREEVARAELLQNDSEEGALLSNEERFAAQTDLLRASSKRLEDSHRNALEAESVGANVLETLREQRDNLSHSRNRLHDADSALATASSTVTAMLRYASKQRYVTYAVIGVLVVLILFVAFLKL